MISSDFQIRKTYNINVLIKNVSIEKKHILKTH